MCIQMVSEDVVEKTEGQLTETRKIGFLRNYTKDAPVGAISIGVVLLSSINALIGFTVWSIDPDFLIALFYFALSVTVIGGIVLIFLLFCIFSKGFLRSRLNVTGGPPRYFKQVIMNLRNLLNPNLFNYTALRVVLLVTMSILALCIFGFMVWFLVFFIQVIISLS